MLYQQRILATTHWGSARSIPTIPPHAIACRWASDNGHDQTMHAEPMLDLTAQPTRMVRTRFLGPTDTRGSRAVAYSLGAGNRAGFRAVFSWNHSLDSIGNHETAARYLVRKIAENANGTSPEWDSIYCSSEDGGGYVFAFVRTQGAAVPQ